MNRGLATRLKLMNYPITRCQFTHMRPARSAHLTPISLLLAAALFGLGTMNLAGAPGSDGGPTNSNPQLASTREYAVQSGVRPVPPARQMTASQRWEWEQRAYPLGYIPEGAFPRAREPAFDVVIRNAIPQKTIESAGYFENI